MRHASEGVAQSFLNGVELAAFDTKSITVGIDCMFSSGVRIMTTDYHSIYDIDSGELINQPADVVIGNHVWIGRGVQILKGSFIEDGSIVGAGSLVAGHVHKNCLAIGIPARVARERVRWER